jgi:VWFA-related protein
MVKVLANGHVWLAVLAWCLLPCGFAPGRDSSDAPDLTYRSTVAEVRLTFFATDERQRTVDSITKTDFAVVDNELVVRDFRSFMRSTEVKLDATLLVDTSESVARRYRQEITDVVHLISQTQWGPDDRISVMTFGGMHPRLVCRGDCRSRFAANRLFAEPARGLTPLFDATVLAANAVARRRDPQVRPILIVFSDGGDTVSIHSATGAIESALAADAQIYTVDLSKPQHATAGAATLQRMADATGGRYFSLQEGAARILAAMLEDLHTGYLVTYALPSRSAGLHVVRILPTHNLNLRFRCRRGYYYESGAQ